MISKIGRPPNKLASRAISPKAKPVEPPANRAGDPQFMGYWDALMGDFVAGYFILSDVPIIEQYIDICMRILEISDLLDREDYVVDTKNGPKTNPLSTVLGRYRTQQRDYARMLRVGPATRADGARTKETQMTAPTGDGKITVLPLASQH